MNTEKIMSMSLFVTTDAIADYVASGGGEHYQKYVVPLIIFAVLTKQLGLGLRLYLDACTYRFWKDIDAPGCDMAAILLDDNAYDMKDRVTEENNARLHAEIKPKVSQLQRLWDDLVASKTSLADALCVTLWNTMNDSNVTYIKKWSTSAQLFTVDLKTVRPSWYEMIHNTINSDDTVHDVLVEQGFLASVYRLFSMRQYDAINETIDGVNVKIPVPRSIHVRDAHTTPPSYGDIAHIDHFDTLPQSYEWIITPPSYRVSWASFTPTAMFTPICNYVNAKQIADRKCIMSDDEYYSSVGMVWDDTVIQEIAACRGYDGRKPVAQPAPFAYGIDEILITFALGYVDKIRSPLSTDPIADCFNSVSPCGPFPDKTPRTLPEHEKTLNRLSRHVTRSPNSIFDNSVVLPLMYNWALHSGIPVVFQPPSDITYCAIFAQTASALFFPIMNNRYSSWDPKHIYCVPSYVHTGGSAPADKNVGLAVIYTVFDPHGTWTGSGYNNLTEFIADVSRVVDTLCKDNRVSILYEYSAYMKDVMKPFDMMDDDMLMVELEKKLKWAFTNFTPCD
jgi:hypothetical protein